MGTSISRAAAAVLSVIVFNLEDFDVSELYNFAKRTVHSKGHLLYIKRR